MASPADDDIIVVSPLWRRRHSLMTCDGGGGVAARTDGGGTISFVDRYGKWWHDDFGEVTMSLRAGL